PVVEDGGQGQSSLPGFPDATAVAPDGLCAFGPENGHATAHRPPLFCPIGRHLSGFYHRLPPSDLLGGDQYRPFLFDRLFWTAPHFQKSILPLLFWFLGHGMPYFLPWDIGLAVPVGLRWFPGESGPGQSIDPHGAPCHAGEPIGPFQTEGMNGPGSHSRT